MKVPFPTQRHEVVAPQWNRHFGFGQNGGAFGDFRGVMPANYAGLMPSTIFGAQPTNRGHPDFGVAAAFLFAA